MPVLTPPSPYLMTVDAHAAQFGAKGDAIAFGSLIEFTTNLANDTVAVTGFSFDASWIGKKFFSTTYYEAPNGRTVIGVTGGKLILDIGLESFEAGSRFIVGTDDTAAIDAALQYARSQMMTVGEHLTGTGSGDTSFIMGGTVMLRAGHSYIVRNPSNLPKRGCIQLYRRTGICGAGRGRSQTQIHVAPGSYGHAICNIPDEYTDFCDVGNLHLWCHGPSQPKESIDLTLDGSSHEKGTPIHGLADGINLRLNANNYDWVEAYNCIHDMVIVEAPRDGIFIEGRGENILRDINTVYAGRFGAWLNSSDMSVQRVNTGGSTKTGMRIENAESCNIVGSKSYYSGGGGDTVVSIYGYVNGVFGQRYDSEGFSVPNENHDGNCANWHLTTDNDYGGNVIMAGCESQESRGSGLVCESGRNKISMMIADPGRTTIGPGSGQPTVITGVYLKGNFCNNNVLDISVQPQVDSTDLGNAQSVLYVDGLNGSSQGPQVNKGNIWTIETFLDGATGASKGLVLAGAGALAQGGGTSNGKNTKLKVNTVALT